MIKSQDIVHYFLGRIACKESIFGKMLQIAPVNDTVRQVLSIGLKGQFAYLDNLWRFNHKRNEVETTRSIPVYKSKMAAGMFRRYNQLPCTVASRVKRADLLKDHNREETRVLVLGDDDLLSVELAKRDYKAVTVADCDSELLKRIAAETNECTTKLSIVNADFCNSQFQAKFASIFHNMNVIYLDPPYSVKGAQTFLSLAVKAAAPKSSIYLMINPFIFADRFEEITKVATQAGFKLARHLPSFNGYPIGLIEEAILRAAWRVMMNLPPPNTGGKGDLLFCSDCYIFERS